MALQNILKNIQKQAEDKIKQIEKDTKKEVETIKKESESLITETKEKEQQKNKETIANLQGKVEFFLRQEERKILLEHKQSIINECFETALKKLKSISKQDYIDLNTRLIKSLPDERLILCSAKNKISLLKEALEKSQKRFTIDPKEIDAIGGFIAISEKVEFDMTFKSLVDKFRAGSEDKIIKTLFG